MFLTRGSNEPLFSINQVAVGLDLNNLKGATSFFQTPTQEAEKNWNLSECTPWLECECRRQVTMVSFFCETTNKKNTEQQQQQQQQQQHPHSRRSKKNIRMNAYEFKAEVVNKRKGSVIELQFHRDYS